MINLGLSTLFLSFNVKFSKKISLSISNSTDIKKCSFNDASCFYKKGNQRGKKIVEDDDIESFYIRHIFNGNFSQIGRHIEYPQVGQ